MWTIREKMTGHESSDSAIEYWVNIGAVCFFNHSYFTSIGEFCVIREKIASWLVSLNCLVGYTTVQSLYFRASYSFLQLVRSYFLVCYHAICHIINSSYVIRKTIRVTCIGCYHFEMSCYAAGPC